MSGTGRTRMVAMMPDDDNEKSFLSRWSRRKRQGPAEDEVLPVEEQPALASEQPAAIGELEVTEVSEPSAEELEMQANLEAAQAVDLESLDYESDFEVFMKKGVPDALKNAAMQKLWRSNPALAVLDGLNDYDEDFGDPALNVFKSTWEVGRGFLSEDEMHHTPADKAKAFVEKLLEDEPESATEIAATDTQAEDGDIEPVEAEEISTPLEEAGETPAGLDEEVNEQEADQPRRVSIRSRIFDYTGENS